MRQRALTQVLEVTAALKNESVQKEEALQLVGLKEVEIEDQKKEVAQKEEEKKFLQSELEEHAKERTAEKEKLLQDLAMIEERAKQGDVDKEQIAAERDAKLQVAFVVCHCAFLHLTWCCFVGAQRPKRDVRQATGRRNAADEGRCRGGE